MAMVRKQKGITHDLRYNAELNKGIETATKKGGFSSHGAFIRAAIERGLAGREKRRRCGCERIRNPQNIQKTAKQRHRHGRCERPK